MQLSRELKLPLRLQQIKRHKIKHLHNGDYFAIVALCSHSILLTNYATGGLIGAPYN